MHVTHNDIACNLQEEFNISNGLSGSPEFYQISYSDYITNSECGLVVIPAQSCINSTCDHLFNVSSTCPNSSGINVTVSGFSILGEGRISRPVTVPGLFTLPLAIML